MSACGAIDADSARVRGSDPRDPYGPLVVADSKAGARTIAVVHECDRPSVDRDEARDRTVEDVMVRRPKTLPAEATVSDVRRLFGNESVRTALLVDGDTLAGALEREDLPSEAADGDSALRYAEAPPFTISADASVVDALARMDAAGSRRLVVVDDDGTTLRGLICLTADLRAFCSGS
jgi:CBS domain-containing protein